ncbi:hypothetical protein BaRGS_00016956, partial [Batillaria attramentaria]
GIRTLMFENLEHVRVIECYVDTSTASFVGLTLYTWRNGSENLVSLKYRSRECKTSQQFATCNFGGNGSTTASAQAVIRDLKEGETRTFGCDTTYFDRKTRTETYRTNVTLPYSATEEVLSTSQSEQVWTSNENTSATDTWNGTFALTTTYSVLDFDSERHVVDAVSVAAGASAAFALMIVTIVIWTCRRRSSTCARRRLRQNRPVPAQRDRQQMELPPIPPEVPREVAALPPEGAAPAEYRDASSSDYLTPVYKHSHPTVTTHVAPLEDCENVRVVECVADISNGDVVGIKLYNTSMKKETLVSYDMHSKECVTTATLASCTISNVTSTLTAKVVVTDLNKEETRKYTCEVRHFHTKLWTETYNVNATVKSKGNTTASTRPAETKKGVRMVPVNSCDTVRTVECTADTSSDDFVSLIMLDMNNEDIVSIFIRSRKCKTAKQPAACVFNEENRAVVLKAFLTDLERGETRRYRCDANYFDRIAWTEQFYFNVSVPTRGTGSDRPQEHSDQALPDRSP